MDRTDPKANRASRDTSPANPNGTSDALNADQPLDELCDLASDSPAGEDDGVDELLESLEAPTLSHTTPAQTPATTEGASTPSWQQGTVIDRRVFNDRREMTGKFGPQTKPALDKGSSEAPPNSSSSSSPFSGLERRRGRGRRLSDFSRSAEEGDMTKEQFMFLVAVDEFKKANDKTFPTWTDVLEVIRLLGYRKTMPSELNLRRAEDWREPAFSPSCVRPPNWAKRKAA